MASPPGQAVKAGGLSMQLQVGGEETLCVYISIYLSTYLSIYLSI